MFYLGREAELGREEQEEETELLLLPLNFTVITIVFIINF